MYIKLKELKVFVWDRGAWGGCFDWGWDVNVVKKGL